MSSSLILQRHFIVIPRIKHHSFGWLYPTKESGERANCFYMPEATMPWDKSERAPNKTPEVGRQSVAIAVVIAIVTFGLPSVGDGGNDGGNCIPTLVTSFNPESVKRAL